MDKWSRWDEITYPYPNFNAAAVEIWEWIYKSFHPTLYDGYDYLFILGLS